MVSYRGSDGQQQYHETDELGPAIAFVEHLRNDEAVAEARIFKLDEVTFEFRPYYRVELADSAPSAEAMSHLPPPPPAADSSDVERDPLAAAWMASEGPDERAEEAMSAGMGRRGLFGR